MSTKEQTLDKIAENIKLNKIKEDIDNVYHELIDNYNRPKIPEKLFTEYFLPYMTGTIAIPKDKNIIAEWISISGSPSGEVDLIDDYNKVVATVPPIINSDLTFNEDRSFTSIYNEFDLRLNNIPALANRYLNEQLTKKANSLNQNIDDIAKRWQLILERYGYATVRPKTPEQDVVEDLDYD